MDAPVRTDRKGLIHLAVRAKVIPDIGVCTLIEDLVQPACVQRLLHRVGPEQEFGREGLELIVRPVDLHVDIFTERRLFILKHPCAPEHSL